MKRFSILIVSLLVLGCSQKKPGKTKRLVYKQDVFIFNTGDTTFRDTVFYSYYEDVK